MTGRVALPYSALDIARRVPDLVSECADLSGFLADLTTFCSDQLSRDSGDVACGMTMLRPSGAPVAGVPEERARTLEESQAAYREGQGWPATFDAAMVLVTDLRSEERCPGFIDDARGEGIRIAALQETQESLRSAMAARSPVDTAVGVIIGRGRCGRDIAVEWLFRAARTRGIPVRDLATEIIDSAGDAHPLKIHFKG